MNHDDDWRGRQAVADRQDETGSKLLLRRVRPKLPPGFEFTSGMPVVVRGADQRPLCELCDEPLCLFHEEHFADCPCPGPASGLDAGWALIRYRDGKLVAWPVRLLAGQADRP